MGMTNFQEAQQRHIQLSLETERLNQEKALPRAKRALRMLVRMMIREMQNTDPDWSESVLRQWSLADMLVTLAVSGQTDGYFNDLFPDWEEMWKALKDDNA